MEKKKMTPKERQKAYQKEYYSRLENKERIKEYRKEYYQKNKEKLLEKKKEYYSRPENKERKRAYRSRPEIKERYSTYQKEYRLRPEIKEQLKAYKKNKKYTHKLEVYLVYSKRHSNSDIPCCRCCGETEIDFLSLDHINNDGAQHRKEVSDVILWAIKNNFPPTFQILCMNCNFSKGKNGNNGKCAHEKGEKSK